MKNKKIIGFVHSLVMLPIMFTGLTNSQIVQSTFVQKVTGQEAAEVRALEAERQIKAEAIDTYFAKRDMPLEGMGMNMVIEAEKNDLDWRILAAIAVRESTGGKHDCKKVDNNAFGWGSCKIGFKSDAEAVATVARNLGGNNPKTARHYDNKTTLQILRAYNPPSIVPRYAEQVISIMDAIGDSDLAVVTVVAKS